MGRESARCRASASLSWWLCIPGAPAHSTIQREDARGPGPAGPAAPPGSLSRGFHSDGAFIEKSDGKPAWEASATCLSLFEDCGPQSLTSSWT